MMKARVWTSSCRACVDLPRIRTLLSAKSCAGKLVNWCASHTSDIRPMPAHRSKLSPHLGCSDPGCRGWPPQLRARRLDLGTKLHTDRQHSSNLATTESASHHFQYSTAANRATSRGRPAKHHQTLAGALGLDRRLQVLRHTVAQVLDSPVPRSPIASVSP